jgi:integrase/recombinase XerD
MSLSDVIKAYLNYLRVEKGLAQNTLDSYAHDLKKLKEFAEQCGKPIDSLSRQDLIIWLKLLTQQGASPRSRARHISSVKGIYKFLLRDGMISGDPSAELTIPETHKNLPHFLTEDEIALLIEAPDIRTNIGIRDRAILELMYATGLRVSELVDLQIGDVKLEQALLSCKGKGSKQRIIPLGRASVLALRNYLKVRYLFDQRGASKNLFVNKRGLSLKRQSIWRLLKKYSRNTKLKRVSPHSLRHSFATHLIQRGADSRSLQALLGHSDISTTQIYTHISNHHLRQALEAFHPRGKR